MSSSYQSNEPCFHTNMSTKLHDLTANTECGSGGEHQDAASLQLEATYERCAQHADA
jgi:hypothetical protein